VLGPAPSTQHTQCCISNGALTFNPGADSNRSRLPDSIIHSKRDLSQALIQSASDSKWPLSSLGGTVKLSGVRLGGAGVVQISVPDDDAPRPALRWLSLPRRDHQLCGLAVFPVPVKPAHGRRDAGGSRPFGHLRDGPAVGPEIRPGIRQPHSSASSPPRRQMAP